MSGNTEIKEVSISEKDLTGIIKIAAIVGQGERFDPFLRGVELFKDIVDQNGLILAQKLNEVNDSLSYRELLSRYLLVHCVLDQGPEITGVSLSQAEATNQLYSKGIKFLHNPKEFFDNITKIVPVINRTQKDVSYQRSRVTGIKGYSLLRHNRIIPSVLIDWGAPLLLIYSLQSEGRSLLQWVHSWRCADDVVNYLKHDRDFGLGDAIGDKACRLFIKQLIHTYRLIDDKNLLWGQNSYTIPIDSNVGRVLMRTGFVFGIMSSSTFYHTCCHKQANNKINLGANRLADVNFDLMRTPKSIVRMAEQIAKSWRPRSRVMGFPISLNAVAQLNTVGMDEPSIGRIDDGLMTIGTKYCANNRSQIRCPECPMKSVCAANNREAWLIDEYYCGTGEGVFY